MSSLKANDKPKLYREINGMTMKEFGNKFSKIKNYEYKESVTNIYGIIFEFEDESLPYLEFWLADKFDTYRFNSDKNYSENCEFLYSENDDGIGKIRFGFFNTKRASKPRIFAEDVISEFKHLHIKTIAEYIQSEDVNDSEIYWEIYGEGVDYGIELIYANPLKPNIIFRFSDNIDLKKLKEDEDYIYQCQFFYWEDKKGEHIRFAKPYLNNMIIRSIIK